MLDGRRPQENINTHKRGQRIRNRERTYHRYLKNMVSFELLFVFLATPHLSSSLFTKLFSSSSHNCFDSNLRTFDDFSESLISKLLQRPRPEHQMDDNAILY
ncbi:hypothetical protein OCU04_000681 [Sclerotinia nivalis]|uniref:Uncharacterized protein n=1 Tax=Sclerotinia nivalis TaxID=352851 RepID=A0A9X0AWK7_9HELO|nr:hypothetical protein OCU04_000681 [Sclerotinia nivalis]